MVEKMEILFIGVACSEKAIKESNHKYYNGKDTVRPQQYFDCNLVRGLSEYCNVKAISEPPVASYPRSRCLWYNCKDDILSENLVIKYISLLNLFGVKTIILAITIFFETLMFCVKNKGKKSAILLGYLSFYTSLPTMLVAKIFKMKTFVMVPDIPKYASGYGKTNNVIRNYLNMIFIKLNKLTENNFDGYILLTEFMNKILNLNKKPYIIIEGFVRKEDIPLMENICKESRKIVMYAGTLHERFGIKKLVEIFKLINIDECELWLYGEGDYLNKLQEESVLHSNIKYKGIKSKEEILKLEREVTLLINPRPSEEEFTKYSFPSKTIEYMSSGTPLLITKLLGIPEEYFKYVYTFQDESIEGMTARTKEILSLTTNELREFGEKAREFVIKNKNNLIQAEKIYNFICKI